MPTKYRFVTNGDYIEFYDNAMLVTTAHNSSENVSWNFDQTPGIKFEINGHNYSTDDVSEISFDGDVVNSKSEFVEQIETFFPGLAGSSSGGIDDVLAEGQPLTAPRSINLDGNSLTLSGGNVFTDSFTASSVGISGNGGQIFIKSADGTNWIITVNDAGELVVTED